MSAYAFYEIFVRMLYVYHAFYNLLYDNSTFYNISYEILWPQKKNQYSSKQRSDIKKMSSELIEQKDIFILTGLDMGEIFTSRTFRKHQFQWRKASDSVYAIGKGRYRANTSFSNRARGVTASSSKRDREGEVYNARKLGEIHGVASRIQFSGDQLHDTRVWKSAELKRPGWGETG